MKRGDIRVRVGTYTGPDGKEKGRYITVGVVHEDANGELYGSLHSFIDLGTLLQLQRADANERGKVRRDDVGFGVYSNGQSSPAQGGDDAPF